MIENLPDRYQHPTLRRLFVRDTDTYERQVPDLMVLKVGDVFRLEPPIGMTRADDPHCPSGWWIVTGEPRSYDGNQGVQCEPYPMKGRG